MRTKSMVMMMLAVSMLLPDASGVSAGVVGPLLGRSVAEIGVQVTYVDRILGPRTSTMTISATDFTLVGRYGLTENATLSCELYTGDRGVYQDSGYDVRYYTVGAGIQLLVWDGWGMRITVGSHFKETFIFSEDGLTCQEEHKRYAGVVMVEKPFEIFGQETSVWGGSGLYWYSISAEKSWNSYDCRGWTRDSPNSRGYTLGVNLILWEHVGIYSSFDYIDSLEPRAGIMYRF